MNREKPGQPQDAGARKIEVTSAAVRAAIEVVANDYGVCSEQVAEGLVRDIFAAMIAAQENQAAADAKKQSGAE